jgi:aspartyl/asparaginyl beta-hydroxylase (cupin superfamily)
MKPARVARLALMLPVYLVLLVLLLPLLAFVHRLEAAMGPTAGGRLTCFPRETFAWADELESNFPAIRRERDAVLANVDAVPSYQDVSPEQRYLSPDDKWRSMIFSVFGRRIERNCRMCPQTARALERIPGLIYAMSSILKPGSHLAAHRGPYAGALSCHLALKVPEKAEEARMRVGSDIRSWQEGKLLVFNDRNEHEVWNDSGTIRVVLLMYVVRPLPLPLSTLNGFVMWIASKTPRVRNLERRAETA